MAETDSTKTDSVVTDATATAESDISSLNINEVGVGEDSLDSYYQRILNGSFDGEYKKDQETIIDVVTNYWWTTNKPIAKQGVLSDVPFLCAIEYRQKYGVTITNLLNNIYAMGNQAQNFAESFRLGGVFQKVSDVVDSAFDGITGSKKFKSLNDWLTKNANVSFYNYEAAYGRLEADFKTNSGSKSDILKPYSHLYALQRTNKQFCFPFFGNNAAQWSINNSFSEDGSVSFLSKTISNAMHEFANGITRVAADVREMTNLFSVSNNDSTNKGFSMYNIEKAKAFSFPTGGKTVTVRFPLFNTVEKDSWKKNYRFIVLFGLRNMLFRLNNVQYYPPLLYDVNIPGWGRMPLSYVSSYGVDPVGMTRVKSMNMSFLNTKDGTTQTSVIVPEAWIVSITFQSLIADSANQFLSSIFDLPITAQVQTS